MPEGCQRCNAAGMAEVAVHYADHVRVIMAHCTCNRGEYYRMRRADSESDGNNGRQGLCVTEYAERMQRVSGVRGVYVFPTPAEKRLDLTVPKPSPWASAKVSEILDAQRWAERRDPSDDWQERW